MVMSLCVVCLGVFDLFVLYCVVLYGLLIVFFCVCDFVFVCSCGLCVIDCVMLYGVLVVDCLCVCGL